VTDRLDHPETLHGGFEGLLARIPIDTVNSRPAKGSVTTPPRPNDRSSGTFEYEDGPHHMVIQWNNGVVTRVENKGASGSGLGRTGTITIVDGD